MNPDVLVALDAVSVVRGATTVLDGVSLEVPRAKVVTLVGPNGAGKTTLLEVVLGLVRPQSGQVVRRPDLRVGYVPQRLHVDPTLPLTVDRFLMLGLDSRPPAERLRAALAAVGARHVFDRQVCDISGGELQRVMLARAMLRRPELLVLDEPVGNVDVAGQAELYEAIGRLRQETGCGVLMVSHDLHLVMAATDRVICLNRHVCCAGAPHDVSRDPAYVGLFGDRVAGALAVYAHRHDHRHGPDGRIAAKPDAEGPDG